MTSTVAILPVEWSENGRHGMSDPGVYDPALFAKPGDNDLTIDLNHLVFTDVVCISDGSWMSCMAMFDHGLGFWVADTGRRHTAATPVSGTVCWTGQVMRSVIDEYIATCVGTIDWWVDQVASVRFTAAPGKVAMFAGADDRWIGLSSPTVHITG